MSSDTSSREKGVCWKEQPHPSHDMGPVERTIVTLVATSRFGAIRECRKCGGEQAQTVAGEAMHPELRRPCDG